MAGHAEIRTIRIFHAHVEGAPDDHAAQNSGHDSAGHGHAQAQAFPETLAFGFLSFFLSFVCHHSIQMVRWPQAAKRLIHFKSMDACETRAASTHAADVSPHPNAASVSKFQYQQEDKSIRKTINGNSRPHEIEIVLLEGV
ncbi:MAG: hypothetical protein Q7T65_05705 [Thiobacillus sp.]|nr:hypothetical protein [Thiobacillus sp.]